MADLSQPHRQSPLAVLFLALKALGSIGLSQQLILLFFILTGALDGRLLPLVTAAVTLLTAVATLGWWRYTFQLIDDQLVVTKGIIRVDRLTVPFDRIQSISIDQQLLHRITGLVKVTVDTAGSDDAEFTIDALDRPLAEAFQRQTLAGRAAQRAAASNNLSTPTAHSDTHLGAASMDALLGGGQPRSADIGDDAGQVVLRHNVRRLVLTALTAPPWTALAVLGPLTAASDQLGDRLQERIPDVDLSGFVWWWIPIVLLAILIISIVTNFITVFTQHWDLTLRASPQALRRTSGLLSKSSRASSPTRVQMLRSRQNPLQRAVGLSTVGLASIGDGDLSLPGCDDRQVDQLRHLVDLPLSAALPLDQRIDRRQVYLAVRNTAVVIAATTAAGWWLVGRWSLLLTPLVLLRWAYVRRYVQTFRWSMSGPLATRSDVVMRVHELALPHKANAVRVTQTIFERRRDLAHLHLDTAAGTVTVGMIPVGLARDLRDRILLAAETDDRPWM